MRRLRPSLSVLIGFLSLCLPGVSSARDLRFEERVKAQEAIERVAYAHQIGATRSFEQAVPRALLESKVRTYLAQSVALEAYWKTPVTAEALERELERMMRETRMPERLREIFAALGNDRRLILECLARPALVDRLSRGFFASDQTIHADERRAADDLHRRLAGKELLVQADHPLRQVVEFTRPAPGRKPDAERAARAGEVDATGRRHVELADADFARSRGRVPAKVGAIGGVLEERDAFVIPVVLEESAIGFTIATYAVPKITWDEWWGRVAPGLAGESVTAIDLGGPPSRVEPVPLASGRESAPASCPTGGTWESTSPSDLPEPRVIHSAVWTGSLMIVWGGTNDGTNFSSGAMDSGGRYDPATDTWTATSRSNAPSGRYDHTAVWTGTQMIVWGGRDVAGYSGSGGRYDPSSDTWTATSTTNAPTARLNQTAIWTGSRMIIWGGQASGTVLNSGALYDPATDTWTPTSSINAPSPRAGHSAVWAGSRMLVWGGFLGGSSYTNTGSRYDPATDTWSAITTVNAPQERSSHTAVWTGTRMVVWGGNVQWPNFLKSGGRYDPATDSWTSVSTTGAPPARAGDTAVWTGSEMIVFGGEISFLQNYDTIAWRYNPASDTWSSAPASNSPLPRDLHTAVWTGTQMIVWGGEVAIYTGGDGFYYYSTTFSSTGGRYDPATNSWTPTSMSGLPSERSLHTAVWTGSRMIVWGGYDGYGYLDFVGDGARYDPATSTWTSISMASAPSARLEHTAVWSGSRMIVWGGLGNSGDLANGGLYDPIADTWSPVSTTGAPVATDRHSAVWTGSRMIVWGGNSGSIKVATGGRYDPATDSWVATSMANAPSARSEHTAVWTGTRMIVWGGSPYPYSPPVNSGGLYDPATDAWDSTSTVNAPEGRHQHTAVWTGTRMVVWGGYGYSAYLNTGGSFDPGTDSWAPTSVAGAPDVRSGHTAVWTGTKMIVWGGEGYSTSQLTQGGLYEPQSDRWALTSTTGAPVPRFAHTAVWTGAQMIVWGGDGGLKLNSGGVYTPDAGTPPPTADAGADIFIECASPAGTLVHLHGAGDGCGALAYTWTAPFAEGGGTIQGSDVSVTLPPGGSAITLTVTDDLGQQATDGLLVTVQDTTPPALTLTASRSTLWPPNHRLVTVYIALQMQDLCDPVPTVALVSASSSEPDNAPGMQDGDTIGDIDRADLGTADTDVALRAERDASGPGRVYRLTYQVSDAHGNTSTSFVDISVPHDLGPAPEALLMKLSPDVAAGMVRIDWPAIDGATGYDLITGELSQARVESHVLKLGTVRVLAAGTMQTSFNEGTAGGIPATGTALFYLIESRTPQDGDGFGTESAPWPRVPDACDSGCP